MNSKTPNMYLRKATQDDCDFLFNMANDPQTRDNSFNSQPILYETHCEWFNKKLNSNTCQIYIYCENNIPIGQVRLDFEGNKAEIDYSVIKKYQGQGHATKMLKLLEKIVFASLTNSLVLEAKVKQKNIPSVRVFEKLFYNKQLDNGIVVFEKTLM